MHEQVAISWGKYKAGTELERILPHAMLLEPACLCTSACFRIFAAENVEQIPGLQFRSVIGDPFGVNEQWESDTGFLTKRGGVMHVAESNRSQGSSGFVNLPLVRAQLRDMLAAENSTVMSEEDHNCGILVPQRAEAYFLASSLGQHDIREF